MSRSAARPGRAQNCLIRGWGCRTFSPADKGFNASLELAAWQQYAMLTATAFDADVGPQAYHLPFVAAAGVWFPQTNHVTQPDLHDHRLALLRLYFNPHLRKPACRADFPVCRQAKKPACDYSITCPLWLIPGRGALPVGRVALPKGNHLPGCLPPCAD